MPLGTAPLAGLLVALLLASGCTPRLVHRLDAPDPDVGVWRDGEQARTARADGVEAELAYVRSTPDDHALWVRVTNVSGDTLLVDPALFVGTAYQAVRQAEARDPTGRAYAALDPEAQLLEVDIEASRRDARARTRQGLAAVSAGLVAAAVVVDAPDTPDEEAAVADAAYTVEVEMADATAERYAVADARAAGRAYWEGVLRRTTLPPDTYIDGLVHVPIDPAANAVVVDVVVGGARLPFLFLQRNIRP